MSNAVTTAEVALMRTNAEALVLPDTCTLLSLSRTVDGQGGWTDTWGTATASVACRLTNRAGKEQSVADAVQAFSTWLLTVPVATTITSEMRVVHGSDTYNIKAVSDAGSWLVVKQATLERV